MDLTLADLGPLRRALNQARNEGREPVRIRMNPSVWRALAAEAKADHTLIRDPTVRSTTLLGIDVAVDAAEPEWSLVTTR